MVVCSHGKKSVSAPSCTHCTNMFGHPRTCMQREAPSCTLRVCMIASVSATAGGSEGTGTVGLFAVAVMVAAGVRVCESVLGL